MLTDLNIAFGNHAIGRREHRQTFVVDVRTAKSRFGGLNRRVILRGRACDLRTCGFILLHGGFLRGEGLIERVHRLVVLFATHRTCFNQDRATIDRVLCGFHRRVRLYHLRTGHANGIEDILNLTRGICQLRTRLCQCHLRIGRAEFNQHITCFDHLVFFCQNRLNRTRSLRIDHHHAACDIGIFSFFVITRNEKPIQRPQQANQ